MGVAQAVHQDRPAAPLSLPRRRPAPRRTLHSGIDAAAGTAHDESSTSAAMRLDPNTHAFVMATAFLTSICFAIAAMQVIALAIHLFVPGAG
jgi:hypothetical protein